MKKNVGSQVIGAQMVSATDGSAFTSSVTVYVTGDGGTQAAGSVASGACTHEGNGFHTYVPAQAETNYDHIAFTFVGTGAVAATVQVFTTFPQTGDSFVRLGAPAGASVSADVAAVKVDTAAILVDTGTTLDTAISAIKTKTDYLPSATAGASGGVFIAGSNAATSIATALTANITGNITGNLSGSVGSVTGAVGSVTGAVGSVTGAVGSVTGNVGGSVGSLAAQAKADVNAEVDGALNTAIPGTPTAGSVNDVLKDLDALLPLSGTLSVLSAAAVNAEVVDALATDTYAEPGQGAPAATTNLAAKVSYLYKAFRNKSTQTADTYSLFADDASTVDQKATVSDNGTTFTRGEVGAGP